MNASDLPFRLGSTSYVYQGDLVENARRLAGTVRDIELILFETERGDNNLPDAASTARLAAIAATHDLTYTVHLPQDVRTAPHPSLEMARRVIALTAPLAPCAYVFHLEGTGAGSTAWTAQAIRAVQTLCDMVSDPALLALENLENYAPEHLVPVCDAMPIARALDIGHLWKTGRDPLPVIDSWLAQCRAVHLHGVDGADHQSLAVMPPTALDPVVRRLLDWTGVLTLEVFEDDFFSSRDALMESIARCRGDRS